jgi:hypothetical protein
MKNVQDDDTKITQLVMTFKDRALLWYMKYESIAHVGQDRTLVDIRKALLKEFQKPKSKSQCITKLKEIKQLQNESIWDFDQRFKILMDQLTFHIIDEQHREWFIVGFLPHIHFPLTQQKITSQSKALNITMKLEASPVGENGAGMAQVQSQLAALTIQLQKISKWKENNEEVWCVTCIKEFHHKNEFPTFKQYLAIGAPNPFPL